MITIELVLYCLIGFIMIVSILTGLAQGFRKNVYKLGATILFWIIFWVSAPFITGKNLIWYNEPLYQTINSLFNLGDYPNLMEMVKGLIAQSAELSVEQLSDPAFENTVIAICQCIIKIIYLIVLALVYWLVKVIVYHSVFKKYCKINKRVLRKLNKKQARYMKKHEEPEPKLQKRIERTEKALARNKLFRPLGLASGATRGLISSFLILCLVNSLFNMLPKPNDDDVSASTGQQQETPDIYDFILEYCGGDPIVETAINMINDYQNSSLINYTGIKIGNRTADELFIDSIISGKSEDYSFAIRKELKSIITIAEEAYYLTNGFDIESVNWAALNDAQVGNIQTILNILSEDDLINNLASAVIGVAISLDAVAEFIPENLQSAEYENINWGEELATIAELVAEVYSLGDLTKLDYFALDSETVENIVVKLSELECINFLGHIGCDFALKSLMGDDPAFAETIENIEGKLATLATTNGFTNTIYTYKDLYANFIDIISDEALDNFKDEDGRITNYVSALTSIDTTKYSTVIHTVFEANFIKEILPDVLTLVKEQFIPVEYASLINPSVVTSTQWENEINALLTIVRDITLEKETGVIHPFETIETYDFGLLRNFTEKTIIESDLLSYAIIKIFIDTSKSEGLLSGLVQDIANYVSVPDALATPADENHKFNSKWYGNAADNYTDGELYIMLNTIKNCASKLESINNALNSIPDMIGAVNANQLANSDVLYYTVNKLLSNVQNFIIIPTEDTMDSPDTVNGVTVKNMVKRDSLRNVLDILTDNNVIDFDGLYSYYKVNEDGSVAEEPTKKEDIENFDEYQAKLTFSIDNILGLLTSKKLYNPETGDETNLNKLFGSNILRATVSYLLSEYAGEFIAIPKSSSDDKDCIVLNENSELETKTIKVVKQKDFKALIMAVDDLELDLAGLMEDPLSAIDSLKNEDEQLKDEAKALFADSSSSKYCGILHGTISKFIIDFSESDNGSLSIVVPDESIDQYDEQLIKGDETVRLLESLIIVGIDMFLAEGEDAPSEEEMINDIVGVVIDNNKVLDSDILRATLTSFLNGEDLDLGVPEETFDKNFTQDVVEKKHFVDLLTAFDSLKTVKNANSTDKVYDYYDLINIENLDIDTLCGADKLQGNPISSSLILRGIVTNQLEKNEIEVPSVALEGSSIKKDEMTKLIDALGIILEGSTIENINIDNITIEKFERAKEPIKKSLVVRNLVTKELEKQDETIIVPQTSLDSNGMISEQEVDLIIDGLVSLLDKEDSVSNINIDAITLQKLHNTKTYIVDSDVLRATITKQIADIEEVKMPSEAYQLDNENKVLYKEQMRFLLDGLYQMLIASKDDPVTNMNIDNISIDDICGAEEEIINSMVLNATVTNLIVDLEEDNTLVVPTSAYKNATDDIKQLSENEIRSLLLGLKTLLAGSSIDNINIDNITIEKLGSADSKASLTGSYILRATVTKEIKNVETVIVPSTALETEQLLNSDELSELIDGLLVLLSSTKDQPISNINIDNVTIGDVCNTEENLKKSEVLNATVTDLIVDLEEDNTLVVPTSAYKNATDDVKQLSDEEIKYLLQGLSSLLNVNDKIDAIDVNNITIEKLGSKDSKASLTGSYILRATVTKEIKNVDTVIVPSTALETEQLLNSDELSELIDGLSALLSSTKDQPISNINIDNVTIGDVCNAEANLKKSEVLNATVTDQIVELSKDDTLVVPTSAYKNATDDIKQLSENEIKYLLKGLSSLLNVNDKIDAIDVNNITIEKLGSKDSKESLTGSYILRATVTKEIKNVDTVVVPTTALETEQLLNSDELSELIDGLSALLSSTKDQPISNINIDNVTIGDVCNAEANLKKSEVLNATVTDQIVDLEEDNTLVVPTSAYKNATDDIKQLSENEIKYLLKGLSSLLNVNDKIDAIDVNNITIEKLGSKDSKESLTGSYILRATVTKEIKNVDTVVVPTTALETEQLLNSDELSELIDGLLVLLNSTKDQPISNINIDNVTIGDVCNTEENLKKSEVLNATVTKQISQQETSGTLVVPTSAYKNATDDIKQLSDNEVENLLLGLSSLLNTSNKISNIDVDTITLAKLETSKVYVSNSYILRGTITKEMNNVDSVVIPSSALEESSLLFSNELLELIDGLLVLLKSTKDQPISNINIDNVKIGDVCNTKENLKKSEVLNATVTKQILQQEISGTLVVPSTSFVNATDDIKQLSDSEVDGLLGGLEKLLDTNNKISNIDVDTITIKKLETSKSEVSASLIFRATITKQVKDVDGILTPDSAIEVEGGKDVLTQQQYGYLVDGLNKLFASSIETPVTSIDVESITVKDLDNAKTNISLSAVLNATVTNKIEEQKSSGTLVVPTASYLNATDDIKQLSVTEFENLVSGLTSLLGAENKITELDISSLTMKTLSDSSSNISNSYILRATVTKHINNQSAIIVPSVAIDEESETAKQLLTKDEIKNLTGALYALFGEKAINQINDFSSISVSEINSKLPTILASDILRTTISDQLLQSSDVVVLPVDIIDENITDYKVVTVKEFESFFTALAGMGVDKVGSINRDDLSVSNEKAAAICGSEIMRATITKNISINIDGSAKDVFALASDAKATKDHAGNDILVFAKEELERDIASISVLSAGGMNVSIDIATLVAAKQNGKLPTILSANTIRLAVSELLLSPIQVGYITINYNTIASMPGSGMNLPTTVDTYLLPSSTTTTSKQILSVEDVNAFIEYLSSLM